MSLRIGAGAALAAALVLAAGTARAAEITQSVQTFSIISSGPASQALTFDAFNPALGTLQEVRIQTFQPMLQGAFRVSILGAGFLEVRGSMAALAVVDWPDGAAIFSRGGTATATCSTEATGCGSAVEPLTPLPEVPLPPSLSFTDSGRLAQMIGTGTVSLTARFLFVEGQIDACRDLIGEILGSPPTCTVETAQAGFTGGIGVTYVYSTTATAVPEPAGLALFGLGLAATAVLRRRR